jgi:hypothetical protein
MSKQEKSVRWLNKSEAILLDLPPKENDGKRKQNRYRLTSKQWNEIKEHRFTKVDIKSETTPNNYKEPKLVLSAWNNEGFMMDIDKYCKVYGLPRNDISSYKLVSHTGTPFYNIVFKETFIYEEVKAIDFESIIKKHIKPFSVDKKSYYDTDFIFDRLVYTDVHIGMTTNENGYSLYGGKWDEEEINLRLDTLINHTINNQVSNTLIIDELGDFMDGWDGETTRKGHELPQNMDNEKAFDVGLKFKVKMIDSLAPYYDKIICNNICNDNHAGSFGYVVNSAFKQIIETRYKSVIVNNIRKFIDHYYYGKHCFILTHGKDSKSLKFGFKPQLDTKQIEKISNYIDQHDIKSKSSFIEFSKGDSHQKLFDESTSDSFDYYNYGAMSPSSEWVQTNFKKGKSFFEFFNFKDDGNKVHNPYKFEWNIGRKESFNDYL